MDGILKCKICFNSYNNDHYEPLIINCGHTFCKPCILNKLEYTRCPICDKNVSFQFENCSKNFVVQEILNYLEGSSNSSKKVNFRTSNAFFGTSDITNMRERKLSNKESSPVQIERNKSSNNRIPNFEVPPQIKNNIITIKISDNQRMRTNSKKYFNNFEENNRSCLEETNIVKNEIYDKIEEDTSIETIQLSDDRSIFDHSFHDDVKDFFIGKKPLPDTSKLPNNKQASISTNENKIKSPVISKSNLNLKIIPSPVYRIKSQVDIGSLSPIVLEDNLIRIREEIYKTINDRTKCKKLDEHLIIASKNLFFSDTNILITYQMICEDFYIGSLEKSKPSKGMIFYANDDIYEGEFFNNKREGYGVFIYSNGTKCEGMFRNNKQHGYGKLFQLNGEVYMGDWRDGKINGSGVRYHANGDRYSGQYENNIRSGTGTYVFSNGDRYEGTWFNGKATGKGIFYYTNNNVYEGEFQDNLICGKGCFTLANGEIFKGTFNNGLIQGQGIFKSKGETYQGEFYNGKKHGPGNLFGPDGGLIYSGFWNNDAYAGKKNII